MNLFSALALKLLLMMRLLAAVLKLLFSAETMVLDLAALAAEVTLPFAFALKLLSTLLLLLFAAVLKPAAVKLPLRLLLLVAVLKYASAKLQLMLLLLVAGLKFVPVKLL